MARSNSKLTPEQKTWLAKFKARNPAVAFSTVGRVTVAVNPHFGGLDNGQFAVSIASKQEKKIRRKVGEFYAAVRLLGDSGMPVDLSNFGDYAEDAAHSLASLLDNGY